jgi:hypothetical protein
MQLDLSHQTEFMVVIVTTIAMLFGIYYSKTVRMPKIRTFVALEAIEEGIGRALEMGKKVHGGFPSGTVSGTGGNRNLVVFRVFEDTARKCAQKGVPSIYSCGTPDGFSIMSSFVREAYLGEGKMDDFNNPDMVQLRYFPAGSRTGFAYTQAVNNMLQRENVGASFYMGSMSYWYLLGEGAREAGAFTVIVNPGSSLICYAICSFDYALIIGECYAAGAQLSQDPYQVGSVLGGDISQFTYLGVFVVLIVAATLLNKSLAYLLP